MIEKHIVLEDIDPVIFYGVNNVNMKMIQALYPKLKIVARGNVIKVLGDEEEMCAFEENVLALEKHCAQYNSLKEEVILDIVKGRSPQIEKTGDTIVFSVTGKPIVPRSENQLRLVQEYEKNDNQLKATLLVRYWYKNTKRTICCSLLVPQVQERPTLLLPLLSVP